MSAAPKKILIVEDALSVGLAYQAWLTKVSLGSVHVTTGNEALELLETGEFKVVLLDLQLPDIGGMEIMEQVRNKQMPVTVVVVTSSGSIQTAIDVMRAGAYDYLVKPAAQERLITTTKNALEREVLQATVTEITKPYKKANLNGFVGSSLPMVAVYRMIEAVGRSTASVFITGESGTGKEVCAQAIHKSSSRQDKPFVALNCAAIPKDLIESEIFGHLKGAFTGATSSRDGAAFAANGGTLFLDEICEMDLNLQSKLLRFLQTGAVQKVGSDKVEKVDVRILCATNRDPLIEVEEGRFREDLYYRLHVVPIHLPPLRERDEDVVEIAEALLTQITGEEGKDFTGFSDAARTAMMQHSWPGNVRELQNVVRNAVILHDGDTVDASMLTITGATARAKPGGGAERTIAKRADAAGSPELLVNLGRSYDEIEREIVEATIAHCQGSIPKAAEMLRLSPSTIYRKRDSWAATAPQEDA
ncbi:MAG: sigma-54 dependent transcriptional regulator [Rhizobiaceae bacterium]